MDHRLHRKKASYRLAVLHISRKQEPGQHCKIVASPYIQLLGILFVEESDHAAGSNVFEIDENPFSLDKAIVKMATYPYEVDYYGTKTNAHLWMDGQGSGQGFLSTSQKVPLAVIRF